MPSQDNQIYQTMRGKLTEEIKMYSQQKMGYEISERELRLMPYIQHQMMNEQRIDPNRINQEEREILSKWRKAGYIEGGASGLAITKEFWDNICEICFMGYVID